MLHRMKENLIIFMCTCGVGQHYKNPILAEMYTLLDITAPTSKSAHCKKGLIFSDHNSSSPHIKTRLAEGRQRFMFPLIITCILFPSTKLHTWAKFPWRERVRERMFQRINTCVLFVMLVWLFMKDFFRPRQQITG